MRASRRGFVLATACLSPVVAGCSQLVDREGEGRDVYLSNRGDEPVSGELEASHTEVEDEPRSAEFSLDPDSSTYLTDVFARSGEYDVTVRVADGPTGSTTYGVYSDARARRNSQLDVYVSETEIEFTPVDG